MVLPGSAELAAGGARAEPRCAYLGYTQKSLFRAETDGWKHPGSASVGVLVPLCSSARAYSTYDTDYRYLPLTWTHVSSEAHVYKCSPYICSLRMQDMSTSFILGWSLSSLHHLEGYLVLHAPPSLEMHQ